MKTIFAVIGLIIGLVLMAGNMIVVGEIFSGGLLWIFISLIAVMVNSDV